MPPPSPHPQKTKPPHPKTTKPNRPHQKTHKTTTPPTRKSPRTTPQTPPTQQTPTTPPTTTKTNKRKPTKNQEAPPTKKRKLQESQSTPKTKTKASKEKKAAVPAKRVQQFNYRSNIGTVIKLLKGVKFTKAQQTELEKTPFWPLINALSSTQLKASWCRCYNSIVAEMTTLYNKRKRSFVLGKKEMKLRSSDVKLIFGIDCGEDSITTKSYARPKDFELPFYKRRCKSVKRLDGKSLTKMFQQTKKGKSTNDRQDLARVITLYLCLKLLMPTTGHTLSWSFLNYVDNLNNIKKYNWVEAIKDTLMNSMANANNNPRHVTGCVMLLLYWYCEHSKLLRPSNKEGFPRFMKWNLGKMYSKWKHISLAHFEKVNQSALTLTEQEIQLFHINQSTSTDSSAKKQDHKKDNKQKKKTKATKKRRLLDSDEDDFLEEEHHSEKQKPQEEPESDEQEEKSDDEKNQVTDEEKTDEEETEEEEETETEEETEEEEEEEEEQQQQQQQQEKEEEPDEQQDNDKAEERQQTKGDQQEDLDEEEDQQQEQEEQQTNQQEEVNEQELTNQQEELQEKSNIFHAQGHDQPQTPTKEDDKDKLISAMRAQMQEMEQKFMAELRKKEDQLKEMSTKKTGSPQQRSMVKRIKQKSRKQAHDPDFEYQPMTKPKEDARNKTQTAVDVPKPTQGTDEEKEKKNDNKKEGAHEAKQQQKEKMQEHIGQEKAVAAETNPKEHANQKKTKLQVLESDDDFQEESIPNKPLAISCRKTNKVWHSLSKKDQDQIQLINNTQSSACVWSGSEDENCVYFSDICRLTNREPLYGNVIDAFSEKQLALQPTIEEFEKNDLVFASNPYAGRSYVFSTFINTPLQNQDQALREKLMDNHFPEAMKNRYIHFPINHDNHWTIVVFDNADGIWRHYDSLRPAKDCHNKHFEIAKQIQQHQLRWNKALLSKQGNMLSSQECETEIASIEECPQQTPYSNDCAIAVCNVINQYLNWQPVQKKLCPTEWVKFRAQIINQFLNDENRSWKLEHYQILTKHTKPLKQ
ncbi:unnamed protein product [Camellia sinensis]